MQIEGQWADNYKTIQGDIVHTLVDDPFFNEKRSHKHIVRSMPVFSNEYGIYGIADCVEFIRDPLGIPILAKKGNYKINIVEYKNGRPQKNQEINHSDTMQIIAQAVCIEEMFKTKVTGQAYYAATKKRINQEIRQSMKDELSRIIKEMRECLIENVSIRVPVKQNCSNCSMYDICLPKAFKRNPSTLERIKEYLEVSV